MKNNTYNPYYIYRKNYANFRNCFFVSMDTLLIGL